MGWETWHKNQSKRRWWSCQNPGIFAEKIVRFQPLEHGSASTVSGKQSFTIFPHRIPYTQFNLKIL